MGKRWNAALQSLVLVRLGQELGSDSSLARSVAAAIDCVLDLLRPFF